MNRTTIILAGIAAIALIIFLVMRNRKDEKNFEKRLDNDFHKRTAEDGDIETDEVLK